MATYNGTVQTVPLSGVGDREFYATGTFSWETKGATAYKLEVVVGIHKSSDWYNSPLSGSVAATGQTTKTFSGNTNADKAGTTATLKTYTFSWNRGKSDASKTVTVKVSRVYNGKTYTSTLSHAVTIPALASYAVKYDANGGSGAPSSTTKWYGESLTLSSSKPNRTGYTFSKWNTKSDGSGTSYSSGGAYTANAAVTLYAQWTANKYTVSFDANGGSGAPASQTKTYGQNLTLTTAKPTRADYVFKDWNTAANGSGTSCPSGGTFSLNITTTTTLYAQWYAPRTVSFDTNDGTGEPSTKTKMYGQNIALTDTPPTRAGYTFQGWSTSNTTNVVAYAPNSSYAENNTSSTPDSVTLYAVWKPVLTLTTSSTRYSDAAHTIEDDEGSYAVVECAWVSPVATHPIATVSPTPGSTVISGDTDSTSGTLVIELTGASADITFDVTLAISLAAANVAQGYQAASTIVVAKVLSAIYILDFKEDTSAGILAPADDDYMLNVGGVLKADWNGAAHIIDTVMNTAETSTPSGLQIQDPSNMPLSQDAALAASLYGDMVAVSDMSGDARTNRAHVRFVSLTDGRQGIQLETSRRKADGTMAHNGLHLYLAADGTRTVNVPDAVPWMDMLRAGIRATSTASDIVSAASGTTITGAWCIRWGRIAQLQINFTRSSDLSVVANGNISDVTVATLKTGFRPYYGSSVAHSYGDNAGQVWYAIGSDGVITITACEGTGASRKIDKGTTFNLRAVYLLA